MQRVKLKLAPTDHEKERRQQNDLVNKILVHQSRGNIGQD